MLYSSSCRCFECRLEFSVSSNHCAGCNVEVNGCTVDQRQHLDIASNATERYRPSVRGLFRFEPFADVAIIASRYTVTEIMTIGAEQMHIRSERIPSPESPACMARRDVIDGEGSQDS